MIDSSGKLPHPLFETTDTFQQLIDHLNAYGDSVDANLIWLDSAIGDRNLLTTEKKDAIVHAINEIDSDIYGAGGGNFAADTLSREKTILGAINSVFGVFDPDSAGFSFDSSSFHLVVGGSGNRLSLVSDSDINIIAAHDNNGGDVKISVDDRVQLMHLEQERLNFTFTTEGAKNKNTLYSNGIYEMHSKDSVLFKSDANALSLNGVVDWKLESGKISTRLHGEVEQQIDGDYTIIFNNPTSDNVFTLSRAGRASEISLVISKDSDYALRTGTNLSIESPEIALKATKVTNETDVTSLKSPSGLVYGGLTNESGFLTIRSNQDSAFLSLVTEGTNQRTTQVNGMLELPARPMSGAMSLEFDGISSRKLHDILEAVNNKIPRVYDRDGNLLNTLS